VGWYGRRDPPAALARMVGCNEEAGCAHAVAGPIRAFAQIRAGMPQNKSAPHGSPQRPGAAQLAAARVGCASARNPMNASPPGRISIIGASAGVGLLAVQQALGAGHEVTTLSRRIDSLPQHARLRRVHGSVLVASNVRLALKGADAVVVTLGTGSSTKATTLYTDATRLLLQVLKESGATPPLIALTGFGAGDSAAHNNPLTKLLCRLLLKAIYANKTEMERLIASSYPRWEIVRPGRLTNDPMAGRYRMMRGVYDGMRVGPISRADVAHFLISEATNPMHLGHYVALSG
jgi:putative NADH-flavin reductase